MVRRTGAVSHKLVITYFQITDVTSNVYKPYILQIHSVIVIFRPIDIEIVKTYTVINSYQSGGSKSCTFLEKESLMMMIMMMIII